MLNNNTDILDDFYVEETNERTECFHIKFMSYRKSFLNEKFSFFVTTHLLYSIKKILPMLTV